MSVPPLEPREAPFESADVGHVVNVASRLSEWAHKTPQTVAVAEARRGCSGSAAAYRTLTFEQLDFDSDVVAGGLRRLGARRGTRLALLVRPGLDFVTLVFALLKAGSVAILIDPGMGRKHLLRCLSEAEPEGFVAVSLAQAARVVWRRHFPRSRIHVTVGRRWFWGGATLRGLRSGPREPNAVEPTSPDDPAAIIFTTGSTGPPKGVLYQHRTFDRQVVEIQRQYDIRPGEVDVAGFPLFGLFNAAMGVTTVVPEMDFSRPARVDPWRYVAAIHDWGATQSFASPAVWDRVGTYCVRQGVRLPTLRRVLSAGAPVPPRVLETMRQVIASDGQIHTPYGATEALPVATISAQEVLGQTRAAWARGAGTCVGRRFGGIEWRVIRVVDGPLPCRADVEELPPGQIGELMVRGPQVTRRYVTRVEANDLAKVADGGDVWHRMGDVGYLDEQDRFWFCGRMAHRVVTAAGPMYTIPCEAVFLQHPAVFRAALVGVGRRGDQRPVMIVEPWRDQRPRTRSEWMQLLAELRALAVGSSLTRPINTFLLHPGFPVDIRHNAKIFREQLAVWAAARLARHGASAEHADGGPLEFLAEVESAGPGPSSPTT